MATKAAAAVTTLQGFEAAREGRAAEDSGRRKLRTWWAELTPGQRAIVLSTTLSTAGLTAILVTGLQVAATHGLIFR